MKPSLVPFEKRQVSTPWCPWYQPLAALFALRRIFFFFLSLLLLLLVFLTPSLAQPLYSRVAEVPCGKRHDSSCLFFNCLHAPGGLLGSQLGGAPTLVWWQRAVRCLSGYGKEEGAELACLSPQPPQRQSPVEVYMDSGGGGSAGGSRPWPAVTEPKQVSVPGPSWILMLYLHVSHIHFLQLISAETDDLSSAHYRWCYVLTFMTYFGTWSVTKGCIKCSFSNREQ